jgi:hypothetical protein
MRQKSKFIKAELRSDIFINAQWCGIMRAMDNYAAHYHEEKIKKILRFFVKDLAGSIIFRAQTTRECYNYMVNASDPFITTVEDIIDEIEVRADDFMIAFSEGENPLDLKLFK